MPDRPLRLGISSCLLGQAVRWDGGHKHEPFLTETLGRFVEFVPVCPEVEAGFGVPREPFRLRGDPARPRLVTTRTGVDHTDRMKSWAEKRLEALEGEDLCGYIFKSGSPSSGMERVRVFDRNGVPAKTGVGVFARALMDRFPLLPVEDEGRLHDPGLRENFLERAFAFRRWKDLLKKAGKGGGVRKGRTGVRGALVEFHTRHKLLLMAHSPEHYRKMGKLVAGGKGSRRTDLLKEYGRLFMEGLGLRATPKKNANALQHAAGYFKTLLTTEEKAELGEVIENYRTGLIPLVVPITLMNHYVRKYREPWLSRQEYLNPTPLELKLRNHV